jgi:hypothetical protein
VRLHVGAVFEVDDEAIADPNERLVDRRVRVSVALDRDLVADGELALLDPGDFVACRVLQYEGLSDAQGLPVDLVDAAPSAFSIQKSSPIDRSFSRMRNRSPSAPSSRSLKKPMGATVRRPAHPVIIRMG